MPKIPLCLPKIPLYFLKYNCICPQIPLYYPKYPCICQKYHCVCRKYHCICSKCHSICPKYHSICNKYNCIFQQKKMVIVLLFSHFEVKCSPPFWTFFFNATVSFLFYNAFARLNDDIHNYQYDFL